MALLVVLVVLMVIVDMAIIGSNVGNRKELRQRKEDQILAQRYLADQYRKQHKVESYKTVGKLLR